MEDRDPPALLCPHCGAERLPNSKLCWICHQPPVSTIQPEDVRMASPVPPQRTFSLSSLMLLIALVAVCFGVIREFPGLGVLMIIVLAPALVRTLRSVYKGKAEGQPLSPLQKVGTFAVSMAFVLLIMLAAGIAFFITCWAGVVAGSSVANGSDGAWTGLAIGLGLGAIAAIATGIWLARLVWKVKQ
ncbi:MAG TPA: hypothetical protein VGZ22_30030 [Isosphaeraceae bacterium]|jgi:hypothetical protein|nr:hypothetical protein [Isosphaeraceae bacterium]